MFKHCTRLFRSKKAFYAVLRGHSNGVICNSWTECEKLTKHAANTCYKGFKTQAEAQAFLQCGRAEIVAPDMPNKLAGSGSSVLPTDVCAGPSSSTVTVFTDGCCLFNGQSKVRRTGGIGVFFGTGHVHNTSEGITDDPLVTNNRAELLAVIRALELADASIPLRICTDSRYVILSSKKSLDDISTNKKLWARFIKLRDAREALLEFQWVRGHDNSHGNKQADKFAVLAARKALAKGEGVLTI